MEVEVLRTPEGRFANLPGYPFEPHHVEVGNPLGGALRMHCVDGEPRPAPSHAVVGPFLQEDCGEEVAETVVDFVRSTS